VTSPLNVLIVEDKEDDVLLILRELCRGEFIPSHERVDTAADLQLALQARPWDIVISDYALPSFSGLAALKIVKERAPDLPFIIVSGAIGEELAVTLMKSGAHDYVMKSTLGRLVPAVRRELKDAEVRRARHESERALREAHQRLRMLSSRMLEIQEGERRHVARELHDEIGQALTAVKINLQSLLQRPGMLPLEGPFAECIAIVNTALDQVRGMSLELRPSQLDDLGLAAALRWYLDRQSRLTGTTVSFAADALPARLGTTVETTCFRIAQEAVTNAIRHARAQSIWVELRQREEELHLVIGDNGRGFDVAAARNEAALGRSLGLISMEERAMLAGGRLDIISSAEQGTEIHLRISTAAAPAGPDAQTAGIAQ
jgi:signal transduction histidine kinase